MMSQMSVIGETRVYNNKVLRMGHNLSSFIVDGLHL